jgi:multidrug efflux pump subunit AcrA (membrane-fusion protein)
MRFTKRTFAYIAAGLAVLALAYFSVFREAAVTVETAKVDRGEIVATVDTEGKTRYHERFIVTAPVTGRMFRVQLHEGDRVPKGYVLTRVDPTPTRPLDPLQNPLSGVQPYAYNVYVPEDGILTKIFVTSEGIVQAGTPIAEVSKPSLLEIVADVLSSDATQIRPRMLVRVENWGGDGSLQARVRLVEPQAFTKVSSLGVEEQRVNVVADFVEPPRGLGDNYRVDVKFVLWEGKDVLRIPSSSLFRSGDGWNVFVVERSRARTRTVTIGHRSPSYTEIKSGVEEGETVILHPPTSVTDGTRVSSD